MAVFAGVYKPLRAISVTYSLTYSMKLLESDTHSTPASITQICQARTYTSDLSHASSIVFVTDLPLTNKGYI